MYCDSFLHEEGIRSLYTEIEWPLAFMAKHDSMVGGGMLTPFKNTVVVTGGMLSQRCMATFLQGSQHCHHSLCDLL